MPEENNADQRYHNAFFDQLFPKRFDGSLDNPAPIIGRNDLNPIGQRRLQFLQLFLNARNDVQGVFAVSHDDNPAHHFPFAVEFRYPSSKVSSEVHSGDILDVNWCSILDLKNDVLDVGRTFNIAVPSNEIFCGRNL